jgi:molybdenum cofactor cytidylyltransferase
MGRPKTFLPMEPGGTMLGRVLGTLADAGLDPLIVVAREVFTPLSAWPDPRADRVQVVVNSDPERGQLSSLVCGFDALDPLAPAVMMTLADVPLVRVTTVSALILVWECDRPVLVRPVHAGRHGHPVIFGRPLIDALKSGDLAEGARPVVRDFADQGLDVPVDDPGVLVDLDTPDDYARYI